MQRKARYFNIDGDEVSASRALTSDNVLRNGFSVRVPTIFRDATPRHFRDGRALFDSGQVVITDGDGTLRTANSPGWRISDSPINCQAVHDARARYLSDLQSAYQNPSTGFGEQGAIGSQEGQPCTCRNAEYPEHFGAPGHLRNGVCVPDRADAAPDESRRKRRVWEEPDDDAADQEAEAVSDDDEDSPPFGAGDRRSVDAMNAAHQRNMRRVYDSYARELSEAWKGGNK